MDPDTKKCLQGSIKKYLQSIYENYFQGSIKVFTKSVYKHPSKKVFTKYLQKSVYKDPSKKYKPSIYKNCLQASIKKVFSKYSQKIIYKDQSDKKLDFTENFPYII